MEDRKARLFRLIRIEDESGVSGTGHVAEYDRRVATLPETGGQSDDVG